MTQPLASLLERLQPAGVILFARNIKNPEQTWRLLRECQKCVETPLFSCVDLEGGTVDRLRDALGAAPSAADVFAVDDPKLFRKHGQIIGENCRALGFNVDFAPVLDLAFETSRPVMGSRVVSADPHASVTYAREFLAGLKDAKVLGCGKHFPGLGEGKLDSHHELPVIEKSLKDLWAEDLVPYRALRRQLPFVMVSHAAYPQVTKTKTPASLSKIWITDILKKKIGYRGLVVSDDLEMGEFCRQPRWARRQLGSCRRVEICASFVIGKIASSRLMKLWSEPRNATRNSRSVWWNLCGGWLRSRRNVGEAWRLGKLRRPLSSRG